MSSRNNASLALLNIGGGEIILILVLLFILAVLAVGVLALIYFIVRAVVNRPPQIPLPALPPDIATQNQQRQDREHLKLLAIFHFVFGGLAFLGVGFLCVHYFIMHTIFSNPETWKSSNQPPPPRAFLDVFVWLYLFMGVLLLTGLVLNVVSGVFLWQKRNRLFSLVIGGLDCLQIPFGTALGVFTILVLSRDSVRQLYAGQGVSGPPGV